MIAWYALKENPGVYSLALLGSGRYLVAQRERGLTTCLPARLRGLELLSNIARSITSRRQQREGIVSRKGYAMMREQTGLFANYPSRRQVLQGLAAALLPVSL